MTADDETLNSYAGLAADYAERYGRLDPDEHLEAFLDALSSGALLLDLGCGPASKAARMAERGFEVEAMDATAEFRPFAMAEFGIDIIVGTFADLAATARYDGIFANFSLQHTAKSELPANLSRIATALKPGGLFHIGITRGEGVRRDRFGRLYSLYSRAELDGLLKEAGFRVKRHWTGESVGFDGEMSGWVIIHAERADG